MIGSTSLASLLAPVARDGAQSGQVFNHDMRFGVRRRDAVQEEASVIWSLNATSPVWRLPDHRLERPIIEKRTSNIPHPSSAVLRADYSARLLRQSNRTPLSCPLPRRSTQYPFTLRIPNHVHVHRRLSLPLCPPIRLLRLPFKATPPVRSRTGWEYMDVESNEFIGFTGYQYE